MTSFVPAMPSSSRDTRSGELAVKYGPSVNSGVRVAEVLPALQARVDVALVLLFPDVVDAVASVPLLLDVVAVDAAVAQADRAITQIAMTILKIVFLFICFLHL